MRNISLFKIRPYKSLSVSPFLFLGLILGSPTLAQDDAPTDSQQAAAEANIVEHSLRADIKFLADDLLEGRGPGTRGDLLGQRYIATQFELLGMKPVGENGTWYQSVPLVGVTTRPPKTLTFQGKENSLKLKNSDDYIVTSGQPIESSEFKDAEVLFVGYGMQAPEYDWDDFKDVDVKGKVLLIMNNDPEDDPELFAGRTRLYYGRWDYKYEMAANKGAIVAIIIHATPSAGYPYQVVPTSWNGVQFELADRKGPRAEMNGWLTEDAARQLAKFSGHDLDQLLAAVEKRDLRRVSPPIKTPPNVTPVINNRPFTPFTDGNGQVIGTAFHSCHFDSVVNFPDIDDLGTGNTE